MESNNKSLLITELIQVYYRNMQLNKQKCEWIKQQGKRGGGEYRFAIVRKLD